METLVMKKPLLFTMANALPNCTEGHALDANRAPHAGASNAAVAARHRHTFQTLLRSLFRAGYNFLV
jgi:hypothetical protein